MKVLVIGSGGRDHCIAWKFAQSPRVKKLYVAPGNAGMTDVAECVAARGLEEWLEFARKKKIDLTFVGPESPLSSGIVNLFEKEGLQIVGPTREASRLEWSKCYAKELLSELGVPVPEFSIFSDPEKARKYVREVDYPVVVKADGLAAGKGSIVCSDVEEADNAIHKIMEKKIFGDSGNRVDIEKRLYGRELSFFCFCDGYHVLPMVAAQDYKRAFDGDEGLNTGGMGAYSPHPWLTEEMVRRIMDMVIYPTINGFREKEGILYKGILYAGLMLVEEKDGIIPYVLEINIRLGDPETQVILPRLKNDIVDISEAILSEKLNTMTLDWDSNYHLCLIAVSGRLRGKKGWYQGYPKRYKIGEPISGLDAVNSSCLIFHSGTTRNDNGQLITTGGRVLCVVSRAKDLAAARDKAYNEMKKIYFNGIRYRGDIGEE